MPPRVVVRASAGWIGEWHKMADGAVDHRESKIAVKRLEKTNQLSDSQVFKARDYPATSLRQFLQTPNATISVSAEGKYLSYQWKKDGADLTGETNATLNITDANATLMTAIIPWW